MWTEELVIDGWGQGKDSGQLVDFTFEIGREYDIRLEFCNDARGVRVVFGYNRGREKLCAGGGGSEMCGCCCRLSWRQR